MARWMKFVAVATVLTVVAACESAPQQDTSGVDEVRSTANQAKATADRALAVANEAAAAAERAAAAAERAAAEAKAASDKSDRMFRSNLRK